MQPKYSKDSKMQQRDNNKTAKCCGHARYPVRLCGIGAARDDLGGPCERVRPRRSRAHPLARVAKIVPRARRAHLPGPICDEAPAYYITKEAALLLLAARGPQIKAGRGKRRPNEGITQQNDSKLHPDHLAPASHDRSITPSFSRE